MIRPTKFGLITDHKEDRMPHEIVATRRTPALIIYLIDASGSMKEELDGVPKINHVNEALKKVLGRMVELSTRGESISPRYRIAMAAYNSTPTDVLEGIKTIDEVIKKGKPLFPASGTTDTAAAFMWALDLLKKELPNLTGHPAPMVCHLTDGHYTASDPEPIAREIMKLSNDDGNVLVENIYIGPDLTHQTISNIADWPGLKDASELKNQYAIKLFNMSSQLPQSYAEVILEEGYGLKSGSRMMIPGTSKELVELAFVVSGATARG